MPERVTHGLVTFVHRFSLAGIEGVHKAGTYDVEMTEELIEGLSVNAWRRVAMTIVLPSETFGRASRQSLSIAAHVLEAAQRRDADLTQHDLKGSLTP